MSFKLTNINGVSKLTDSTLGTIIYRFDLCTIVLQDSDIKIFQDVTTGFDFNEYLSNSKDSNWEDTCDRWARDGEFKINSSKTDEMIALLNSVISCLASQVEQNEQIKYYLKAIAE